LGKGLTVLIKSICAIALSILLSQSAGAQVLINEISASNSTIIEDADFNNYSDWIELYNPGSLEVDIGGYYITDDFSIPKKWQIPANTMIDPGGFLLLWADGLDTGLHAGFKLSAEGEELGLFAVGFGLVDSLSFSEQKTDLSYGRISDGNTRWGYFTQSTPGASNSTEWYINFTSLVPKFSMKGGFYTASFSVELSSEQGGLIRFTRDGSEPLDTSEIYSSVIQVGSTTI